jgi:hypothetical protein
MATLQQIIDYSKANPTSDYAKNAASLIQNGSFDTQALKEGIDLSVYGRPKVIQTQPTSTPDTRNIIQKIGGAIADPIATTAVRAGQALGAIGLGAVNKITGGALDKYTPEGNLTDAMTRAINTPVDVPVLGTKVKPFNQETPETVAGQALGTVGLGLGPVAGGAALGASAGMENKSGVGEVTLDAALGMVTGKVLDVGFKAAEPYITAAVAKFGAPILDKLEGTLPDAAKPFIQSLRTPLEATNKIAADKAAQAGASKDLQAIKDMITPKATATEAKLAETQGRLVKGQKPTLLKSGTPDQILTSDQQLQSTMTIQKNIPGAGKMDEPTLYTALNEKITQTAKYLQPVMEKTPIKPETIQKINTDWEALKQQQISSADATEEVNVLKQQKQFEARLQSSGNKNMNDLWNTAKEYDASVPENVKKATTLSSDSLQSKKTIWLQNRAILRSAITDTENGLGKTAQQPFSDMRNMYEAQNGILSKAKVEAKVQPSKLKQAYDSTTGKVVRKVVKYGVGAEVVKQGLGL